VKSDNWETSFDYRAYVESLRELLTSPDVKALIAGVPPVVQEAFEALRLPAAAAPGSADTQKSADALKRAVVTIMADSGSGSGFYIADGYVLSNRHVVSSSRYVKVRLSDGREVVGEVIRQDAARDVALLKTAAVNMPSLPLRASEPPVGENVYAIGSPYGQSLEGTFTRGVMSGLREFAGNRYYQSDVAVNVGNSGGPLLDNAGRVIGITQWGIPAAAGLSFFVPIKDALSKLNIAIEGLDSANAGASAAAPR
jgi:S1-C subfamily serine protease